jgi:hypothetical protein
MYVIGINQRTLLGKWLGDPTLSTVAQQEVVCRNIGTSDWHTNDCGVTCIFPSIYTFQSIVEPCGQCPYPITIRKAADTLGVNT